MSERKTALVTGSGRRLGRKIALALAQEGYDVALHAHRSLDGMHEAAAQIRASGGDVLELQADLAIVSDIRRIASELNEWTDGLDVLVNNAGIFPEASFEEVTEEIWNAALDINLRAQFFLVQFCADALKLRKGCVVNLASAGGFEPWKKHIPYNVSKAGVIMLTRALAKALAPNVRVNAIAPGVILVPGEEERTHIDERRIPLKRYGYPQDIIDAVLYLVRDATYLTGHILPVDGGTTSIGI